MICDAIGWWIRFNKSRDGISNIYVGLGDIMEGIGIDNQVAPSHGAPSGYLIIIVDAGNIP